MAVTSVNDYYNQFMKTYGPKMKADIEQSNTAYLNQSNTIKDIYGQQIDDQSKQYQDLIDVSEAQRYLDEQRIAENMANMGLTDSGLNRTQQTAVQLSASNRANRIDMQRQSAVNALTQAMTAKLADIESARSSAEMGIRQNYENMASTAANNAYKAEQEAAAALEKARIAADAKIRTAQIKAISESIKEDVLDRYIRNGDPDEYGYIEFKNSAGKTVKRKPGENPYTGKINADAKTNGKYDPSKTFSNGYQPNNIGGDSLVDTGAIETVKGNEVTVWKTSDGSLWVWDGENNRYRLYDPKTRKYQ